MYKRTSRFMITASARGDKGIKMVAFGKVATSQALAKEPKRFSRRLGGGEPFPRSWEEQATFLPEHLARIRSDVVNLLRMDVKPVELAARLNVAGIHSSNGKPWTAGGAIALVRALKIIVPSRRKLPGADVSPSPKSAHDLQLRPSRKGR